MKVKIPPRKVYQYKKADYNSMKEELRKYQGEFESRAATEDVGNLWNTFKKKINTLMDKYIPSKLLRGNKVQKPWVSRKVKRLMRKRKKLFSKQRKTGNPRDIRLYRQTKARLQKAESKSYWNFVIDKDY